MLRRKLDNCFSRYRLGNVYFENSRPGFDKCQEDSVILGVPMACRINFDEFWASIKKRVGDINVLHVQENIPLDSGYFSCEKLYFIAIDSAKKILENIDDVMSCKEV